MKILVAEDNPESRYLLERFFTDQGHSVVTANDGREALAAVRESPPDLIVSDALMPGVDGFQLCHLLKLHPEYYRIPFIFYTATYTDASDERFALRIGADRFVVKPIELDRLMLIVEETFQRVRAHPRSGPLPPEKDPAFLEEHGQRLAVKLEAKVTELQTANSGLRDSEQAIRKLNERLVATVQALEQQVTERQAAEEALRLREELLRHAQKLGHIGSWERGFAGPELVCSEETYRIYGVEPGDVRFTPDWVLARVHPDDRDRVSACLLRSEEKLVDLEMEHRLVRPDGSIRHVLVRRQIFRDDAGRPLRFVGIIQDITERKQQEAQRAQLESQLRQAQKMEAIGNLAGGIAHDFNNILTSILAHAELLELELPRETGGPRESVTEIAQAANRARDLVKQILTFSRRQTVERRRIVLAPVIQEALKLVRVALPASIELQCEAATDRMVQANEGQIHQIVLNLCTNAAHAMGGRGGLIRLTLSAVTVSDADARDRPPLHRGEYVTLEVRDDGAGMDAPTLERIYEPFFTTKPVGQGTGLGLAVVHGIVQAHEGAIFVESAPGRGTVFSIYLPVATGRAPLDSGEHKESWPKGKGEKVLFVDDEPSVARTGERLLGRLGYTAVAMTDPVAARDRLVNDPGAFDLVITDYLMPRMTGIDLAKAAWTVRPELPAILAVGFGGQLDAAKARTYGFSGFIAKPFTIQGLSIVIAAALASR